MNYSSGRTLLEVIIVLVIMVIIGGIVIRGYNQFIDNKRLAEAVEGSVSLLQRVRDRTISSKDNVMYGVHVSLASNELLSYSGNDYSVRSKRLQSALDVFSLPPSIVIYTSDATEIGFLKITGEAVVNIPATSTIATQSTITFRSNQSGYTRKVKILPSGIITQ